MWVSRRISASPITLSIVFGFAVLFFMTSALSLPNFSQDLYSYILHTRVFNIYQANPYVVPSAIFTNDPYLRFADPSWSQLVTPYGPTWTYLSTLYQRFIGEGETLNLLALRLLLFGFNLANVILIWKILGELNPAYRLTGVIFYAWNPIVVLKGQGHMDTVMVFFLLLSVYFYLTDRVWLGLVVLTLSALAKFITAPLLVVYLSFLWRRRSLRFAAIGAGIVGAIVLAAFLPVWDGWEMVLRLARSPDTTSPGTLFTLRRIIFAPGFLAVIVWVSLRRQATTKNLLEGWAVITLWFSFFLMPTFYPWYMLTLIAVVSLVDRDKIVAMTLTLCLTALLTNMLGLTAKAYISPSVWVFRFIWWVPPLIVLVWLHRAELEKAPRLARRYLPELRSYMLPWTHGNQPRP